MNRNEMVARLVAQAEDEGADLVTLRAIIEEASELGADRVLLRMGMGDPAALADLSELRYAGTWKAAARPAAPSGGSVVDTEARSAIAAIVAALTTAGLITAT